MRIPAILRLQGQRAQPQRKDRAGDEAPLKARKAGGGAVPGGKRRRRRWENAQLAGNPHLHRPSRADFSPGPSLKNLSPTFSPPPASFSRSTYVSSTPTAQPSPALLASTATHGHFSMSLRGLRRTLRQAVGARGGGRSEETLATMERELCGWLTMSGRIPEGFFHDSSGGGGAASLEEACARGKTLDATPVEEWVAPSVGTSSLPDLPSYGSSSPSPAPAPPIPELTELSRQPHTLVWLAPSPHTRFLLHALARYYALSSFSRPLSPLEPGVRVTHVLRPQIARAAGASRAGAGAGETPPGTDWTLEPGGTTTEGELTSDVDADADVGEETDTDASVLSAPLEEEEDEEDDWEALAAPAPAAAGLTDDEAEAVYSSATESSAEDTGAETDGGGADGRDALARRFAALSAGTGTPSRTPVARLASPLSVGGGSLTPRAAAPPFSPFAAHSPAPTEPATPLARPARGRRSLPPAAALDGGYSSAAESSPSRSPTRAGLGMSARTAFVGVEAGEWRMPERGFVDWIYDA
ncbi:hypothetical protein JCM10450v2_005703 [Rhodotorula kratochvilovae]